MAGPTQRFRIVDVDAGTVIHDTAEAIGDEADAVATGRRDVENGVVFLLDSEERVARCQFVYERDGESDTFVYGGADAEGHGNSDRSVAILEFGDAEFDFSTFSGFIRERLEMDGVPTSSDTTGDEAILQGHFYRMNDPAPDSVREEIDPIRTRIDRRHGEAGTVVLGVRPTDVSDLVAYLHDIGDARYDSVAVVLDPGADPAVDVDFVVHPDERYDGVELVESPGDAVGDEGRPSGRVDADAGGGETPTGDSEEVLDLGSPGEGDPSSGRASDPGADEERADSSTAAGAPREEAGTAGGTRDAEHGYATDRAADDVSADRRPGDGDGEGISVDMSRGGLRIFAGPTGEVRYDSTGRFEPGDVNPEAKHLYREDVTLYVHPAGGEVIMYANGRVGGANEQLVVTYSGSPGEGLLAEFKRELDRCIEANGWSIATEEGSDEEVYANLLGEGTRPPDIDPDELDDLLGLDEPIDFGAPSVAAAEAFITYLRSEKGFDGSVAICGQGRVDPLLSAVDIVVMNSGINYDSVEPRSGAAEKVYLARLPSLVGRVQERLRRVDGRLKDHNGVGSADRYQVLSAAIEDGFGVSSEDLTLRPTSRLSDQPAGLVGVVPAVLIVLGVVGYGYVIGITDRLASNFTIPILVNVEPDYVAQDATPLLSTSLSSWVLLLPFVLFSGLYGYYLVHRFGVFGFGAVFPRLRYTSPEGLDRETRGEMERLVESLEDLRQCVSKLEAAGSDRLGSVEDLPEWLDERTPTLADGDTEVELVVDTDTPSGEGRSLAGTVLDAAVRPVIEDGGLETVKTSKHTRERRNWALRGLGGGVVSGALAAGALVAGSYLVLNFWFETLTALLYLILGFVLLTIGLAVVGVGRRIIR